MTKISDLLMTVIYMSFPLSQGLHTKMADTLEEETI